MFKQIFLAQRFFLMAAFVILSFTLSFIFEWLFLISQVFLVLLILLSISDAALLFANNYRLLVERKMAGIMSLGDENKVTLLITNNSGLKLKLRILDELPFQLQMRNFKLKTELAKYEEKSLEYIITPTCRGEYEFGQVNVFAKSLFGFIEVKQVYPLSQKVRVYPSIINMKRHELKAGSFTVRSEGIKIRRLTGHSYEFDQIKEYVVGDDSRKINWKASSRKFNLMVNQYEDERSQQVYIIIDKSRVMRMPFNDLTLLDHSINSALVMANTILKKHDKVGLITFSNKIGTVLPAEKSSGQLRKIFDALYHESEYFLEAEYELLFHLVRNVIRNRSLIFLYTNFESLSAFERILPLLRKINKSHLLVCIFFQNEEVESLSQQAAGKLKDMYLQIVAKRYLREKSQIATELHNHGIHCINTLPSDLSMNTINKYLELKSRGSI